MTEPTPFLKLFTDDFRSDTLGLTFEQKGFYLDLLILMWERKSPLENEPEAIARSLQADPRKVRRLTAELLQARKLIIAGDQLSNRRMEKELAAHHKRSTSARVRE